MSSQNTNSPGLWLSAEKQPRKKPDREMIPTRLVYAMFSVALAALAITTFAVVTDRPTVGQPHEAPVVRAHTVTISGEGNYAHVVRDDGVVLLDGNGGFVSVVLDGLERARLLAGVTDNPPVTITEHENGRVSLYDPASDWRVELASFGPGNVGTFLTMLNGQ